MPATHIGPAPSVADSAAERAQQPRRVPAESQVAPGQPGAAAPLAPAPPLRAFLRSFLFAGRGLWYALRTQRNMRVHAGLAALAIALGLALGISPVEWALVFVAITGVVITEMINTVVEALVDLASPQYHPLAKVAKDVAAGAVLLNAILAVVIALFVYVPHLWPLALRLLGR